MTQHQQLRIGTEPELAVEFCGAGDVIVFLHGMGGNRSNWNLQLDAFGETNLAVAFDFRGYGDSGDIGPVHAFEDFVDDLARVLDRLEAERAHLVGLSMGGLVAQAFYAAHPDRVVSLGLAATRPGSAPVFPGERQGDFVDRRLRPLEEGAGIETVAERVLPMLLGADPTPAFTDAARESLMALRAENYVKIVRARVTIEPFLDLGDIDLPTLVLAGTHDQVAPQTQMEEIAAEIPGARLEIIEGAGHLMNMDSPAAFNDALRRFLDANFSGVPDRVVDTPAMVGEGSE